MRILFVSPSFSPAFGYGGPIVSSAAICRGLSELGCSVKVLTTDAAGGGRRLNRVEIGSHDDDQVHVIRCTKVFGEDFSLEFYWRLLQEVAHADLVIMNSVFSVQVPATVAVCRLKGLPLLWFPRGSLQIEKDKLSITKRWWLSALSKSLPREVHLQFTSADESHASAWAFTRVSRSVVPNGVDIPPARQRRRLCGDLRLVFIGRLHPIKAVPLILSSMAAVMTRCGRRIELVLIGEGDRSYELELRRVASDLGVYDAVNFVGPIYESEVKLSILDSCDLGVLVSERENFGNAGAEILAAGLPLLVTENLPWKGVADQGCGFVVPRSVDGISDALCRMTRDDLCRRGARGRKWVEAEFSWKRTSELLYARIQFMERRNRICEKRGNVT